MAAPSAPPSSRAGRIVDAVAVLGRVVSFGALLVLAAAASSAVSAVSSPPAGHDTTVTATFGHGHRVAGR